MSALGLSAEALAERKKRIHAGDAAALMEGRWRQVYREKKGLADPEDISSVLRVMMGLYTEPFNLFWCQQTTGREIGYHTDNPLARAVWNELHGLTREQRDTVWPELQVSREYPFMAANLDGMTTTPRGHPCVIDAKHVGKLGEAELLRYTPAMTHQATVMGVEWWALSVLIGNSKHEVYYAEVDPLYQARLIATERAFYQHLVDGVEPADDPAPTLPPKPQPRLRRVSLDGGDFDPSTGSWTPPGGSVPENWQSEFVGLVYKFAATEAAHKAYMATREDMLKIIPDGVGEIVRHRFIAKKDKANKWRMSMTKEAGDDGEE